MNIILIGLRASGKTTVGSLLAKKLARPFIDLDERVLAGFPQKSIRDVWIERGENAWRAAEARTLEQTLQQGNQVIALGGGTPMILQARAQLENARGTQEAHVIYLRCSATQLQHRLMANPGDRPNLTPAGLQNEIASVMAQREPTYRSLADLEFDTSERSPQQCADELALAMSKLAGKPA